MKKMNRVLIFILFAFILSGCNQSKTETEEINTDYVNLTIQNNLPIVLKSVVVSIDDANGDSDKIIADNVDIGEIVEFTLNKKKDTHFKITIKPKKGFSVSDSFVEDFSKDNILSYEVMLQDNEVQFKKIIE